MTIADPNVIVGATVIILFIVGVLKRYGIISLPVNRKEQADMDKYVLKAEFKEAIKGCLTDDTHKLLCKINSLEIEKIISIQMDDLKNQMWPALRLLYRKINGNKDDTEMDEILK